MTQGLFFELARSRRQLALARLAARSRDWEPFPGRSRAPRITWAAVQRLMQRAGDATS